MIWNKIEDNAPPVNQKLLFKDAEGKVFVGISYNADDSAYPIPHKHNGELRKVVKWIDIPSDDEEK